jgi:excisionase family DNA binding protein
MTSTILNYTQIYTTEQAAEVLQINIQTLRKYIREGKIKASKLGAKEYRITGEDIKAFLDATKIKKEIKQMLKDRIEKAINKEAMKRGAMGTEQITVIFKLTEAEKKEFINELADSYNYEINRNELTITWSEE